MPDIITLALIATAAFLGATIAVGYLYAIQVVTVWWRLRKSDPAPQDDAPTAPGVYDWKNDEEVTWRR